MVFCGSALASNSSEPESNFSLTISPLHLLVSVVEINGEFKATNNLGVALILGAGRVKSVISGDSYSVREYGCQLNYYPDSNFNQGVHYGLEVMRIEVELISSSSLKSSGSGVSYGPYFGYKTMLGSGLILVTQLGYQSYSVFAKAQDSNGNSASAGGGGSGLLLNLNVGFSF